jgi:hypothetical protein
MDTTLPPIGAKVIVNDMGNHPGVVTRHNPIVEIQGEKRERTGWVQVQLDGTTTAPARFWNGSPDLVEVTGPAPTLHEEAVEFWFVWTKKGHIPRHSHTTRDEAEKEAERLALINPGRKYIVLGAEKKIVAIAEPAELDPMDDVNYPGHPIHY